MQSTHLPEQIFASIEEEPIDADESRDLQHNLKKKKAQQLAKMVEQSQAKKDLLVMKLPKRLIKLTSFEN